MAACITKSPFFKSEDLASSIACDQDDATQSGGAGNVSVSEATGAGEVAGEVAQNCPPECQVPGCNGNLETTYCRRKRLCTEHMRVRVGFRHRHRTALAVHTHHNAK